MDRGYSLDVPFFPGRIQLTDASCDSQTERLPPDHMADSPYPAFAALARKGQPGARPSDVRRQAVCWGGPAGRFTRLRRFRIEDRRSAERRSDTTGMKVHGNGAALSPGMGEPPPTRVQAAPPTGGTSR